MILELLWFTLLVLLVESLLVVSISLVAVAILLTTFAVIGCIKGIAVIKAMVTSASTGSSKR